MKKIIVIGGGAAGMMAAIAAAENGHTVVLYEKNEKLGKKIYITGKGRCNVTNACDWQTFFDNIISNPKFMFSSFGAWNNQDMMDWLEAKGLRLKTERGNRVVPESDKSSDVIRTLQKELERLEADARALTSTINKGSSSGTKYTGGVMVWPAPQYTRISSEFGGRTHPVSGEYKYHSGMDLAAPGGSPILAAASGKVIIAGNTGNGYGNYVVIDHGGGITTLYGHCSKLLVKKGQSVSRGQQIAKVGSTGLSTGNHLHFEVRVKGACVNPRKYIT